MNENPVGQPESALEADAQRAAFQNEDAEQLRIREAIATGRPTYTPNTTAVDTVSLTKAYGRFVNAQTRFLLQTNAGGTQEYLQELAIYSRAQTELTNALQLALHQMDVI